MPDRPTGDAMPFLSIVIPVMNEASNIPALAAEIERACAAAGLSWEAWWIDDGSDDGSRELLRALPPPHRFLAFDRNYGQSAALAAGFRQARGEWVGTLDGDGQNDPTDLPRQLAHARLHGLDLVNGVRAARCDGALRRLSAGIANLVRNRLTGERVRDIGCSTRVVRRRALAELPFFHGMHRFLPTLVRMRGFAIGEIPVNHRPRVGGRSKYGINHRLWSGLGDLCGVRWLMRRNRVWQVVDGGPDGGEVPGQHPPASSDQTQQ